MLALKTEDFLERRLQTQVFKLGWVDSPAHDPHPIVRQGARYQGLLSRVTLTDVRCSLAKSVHHARVLIRQRHITVGKQVVNVPSFVVRLDSQK